MLNDKIIKTQNARTFLSKSCRISHFRGSLIKDIISKINNSSIVWNNNPYLFAFNNKIFNLKTGVFVKPNPKDYINQTCGYNWTAVPNFKKEYLMNIINQIYPDEEVKDFAMTIFATGLCGIQVQHFIIDTGEGGNGKSFINELMLATCGSYGFKLPNIVVCNEIKDGPNPQVAHLNNKRFVYCEEPSRSRRIYAGTVKELTGAKKLNARLCNDNHCDKTLRLTFKMGCNTIPRFDEVSEAINRRLIAIPY
jgi:phage/plasmid-associated DNA primase